MPHVTIDGPEPIELYYEQQGEGPDLFLIMGLGTDHRAWDYMLPFVDGFRVTRFDNRGVGLSGKPEGNYSMAQFVADAIGLMDALGIERAHVTGVSMGGMIAQHLALTHPDRVERLALVVTSAGGAAFVPPEMWVMGRLMNPVPDPTPEKLAEVHGPVLFSERFRRERPDQVLRTFVRSLERPVPVRCFQSQLAAIMAHDVSARLSEIRMPTLVVSGGEDVLVPPGNSDRIAKGIPDARLHRIEGSGHAVTHETAEELAGLLTRFFAEAPAEA